MFDYAFASSIHILMFSKNNNNNKNKKNQTTTTKTQPVHEVIINVHISKGDGGVEERRHSRRKKVHFQRNGEKTHYRCKGHDGFGMDWEARSRVSASCQYWQVLKTFKEVKTLFSVYKSSAL